MFDFHYIDVDAVNGGCYSTTDGSVDCAAFQVHRVGCDLHPSRTLSEKLVILTHLVFDVITVLSLSAIVLRWPLRRSKKRHLRVQCLCRNLRIPSKALTVEHLDQCGLQMRNEYTCVEIETWLTGSQLYPKIVLSLNRYHKRFWSWSRAPPKFRILMESL